MRRTEIVTSADGVRIAFERRGQGPTLILVTGLLCTRRRFDALAELLSSTFTVVNYDRRGRGESGDAKAHSVASEVADIKALIEASGGEASLYGHSSGAGLALEAASRGLPISRLVLHEPPYSTSDPDGMAAARALALTVQEAIAHGRTKTALSLFFAAYGLPDEEIELISADPSYLALAPTMLHDFEVMGEIRTGGVIPFDAISRVPSPTLVLVGRGSPSFFHDVATQIAEALANGRLKILAGDHEAPASIVAPSVAAFCS